MYVLGVYVCMFWVCMFGCFGCVCLDVLGVYVSIWDILRERFCGGMILIELPVIRYS